MPLARYAVYRGGPQIYVAPTADDSERWLGRRCATSPTSPGAYVVSVPQYIPATAFPADFPVALPKGTEVFGDGGAAIIGPVDGGSRRRAALRRRGDGHLRLRLWTRRSRPSAASTSQATTAARTSSCRCYRGPAPASSLARRRVSILLDRQSDARFRPDSGARGLLSLRGATVARYPSGASTARSASGSQAPVVQRCELDRELPGLVAGLLERELGAVDRGHRLRPRRALQRQARVDRELLGGSGLCSALAHGSSEPHAPLASVSASAAAARSPRFGVRVAVIARRDWGSDMGSSLREWQSAQ